MEVPPAARALASGGTSLEATFEGPHIAPKVAAKWETPQAGSSGSMTITRAATEFHLRGPQIEVGGKLLTSYPPVEQARRRPADDVPPARAPPGCLRSPVFCARGPTRALFPVLRPFRPRLL